LSELANQIIHSVLQARPSDKQISLTVMPSPVLVNPKQASSLALVINELATNTIKHALTEQQTLRITVQIKKEAETILFELRNNGPGFSDEAMALMQEQKSQNVGIYLIQNIVHRELNGEVSLCNTETGPLTVIRFPADSPK
jgi:two-component sensor histidine kinase